MENLLPIAFSLTFDTVAESKRLSQPFKWMVFSTLVKGMHASARSHF